MNVVYIKVQSGIFTIGATKFNSQFGVIGMTRKTRSKYQSCSLFFCTYIHTMSNVLHDIFALQFFSGKYVLIQSNVTVHKQIRFIGKSFYSLNFQG